MYKKVKMYADIISVYTLYLSSRSGVSAFLPDLIKSRVEVR